MIRSATFLLFNFDILFGANSYSFHSIFSSYCGKSFKSLRGRKYCEEKCSGNNQKFECPTCGRKFHQKQRMKNHMRTHTGERPFTCPLPMCNSAYFCKSNVATHIKLTHKMNPREVFAKVKQGGATELDVFR